MKMNLGAIVALGGTLCSWHVFAEDIIRVTVTATDRAVAVGYLVEGKKLGGLGKSYTGTGPINKKYSFGYRTNPIGSDIPCGSILLNKHSKVKLVTKGEHCYTVVY